MGTPLPRLLPAIDERTAHYVVFVSPRRHVDYSVGVGQFLTTAEVDGLMPILVTSEDATVSAHLALEMARLAGRWVVRRADGVVLDALSNREISSFDDLRSGKLAERPRSDMSGPDDVEATAVLGFEVLVHHRATSELVVGRVAEEAAELLDVAPPDVWGSTEPLTRTWNRQAITARAQAEMPSSSRFRLGAPGGGWYTLKYDHGPDGIAERLRGWVPIGPWDTEAGTAVDRGVRLLRGLHERYALVLGSVSLMDMDEDGRQAVRRRHLELPKAFYLGPWTIREAKVDVAEMVAEHGAQELVGWGRNSLLFRMDGTDTEIVAHLQSAVRAIGTENILAAFGLMEVSDGS